MDPKGILGVAVLLLASSAQAEQATQAEPPGPNALRQQVVSEVDELIDTAFGPLVHPAEGNLAAAQLRAHREQFERRHAPQFEKLVMTELHFLRVVCKPTRSQSMQLRTDAEAIAELLISKYAIADHNRARGRVGAMPSNPRPLLARGLAVAAERHLTPQQVESYNRELHQRERARKRVAVHTLVAKLDRHLVLTATQREQFIEVLHENFRESWCSTQVQQPGNRQFPYLPANKLLPILNGSQKAAWHAAYKRGPGFSGLDFGMVQGIDIQLDDWD